jgi:hypothetical protein
MVSDRTGVEHDNVCFLLMRGEAVAHLCEKSSQSFRVSFILLTAVGIHTGQTLPGLLIQYLANLITIIELTLNFLWGNSSGFLSQNASSGWYF